MGLSLKTWEEIYQEHFRRNQQASKKEKGGILDELEGKLVRIGIILSWVLTSYGKTIWVTIDGKRVKLVEGAKKRKSRKRIAAGGRPRMYQDGCIASLTKIWDFFDWPCEAKAVPCKGRY